MFHSFIALTSLEYKNGECIRKMDTQHEAPRRCTAYFWALQPCNTARKYCHNGSRSWICFLRILYSFSLDPNTLGGDSQRVPRLSTKTTPLPGLMRPKRRSWIVQRRERFYSSITVTYRCSIKAFESLRLLVPQQALPSYAYRTSIAKH